MDLDTVYIEEQKLKEEREEANKPVTPYETRQHIDLVERFLSSSHYKNIEELQEIFSKINPDNLEKSIFIMNHFSEQVQENKETNKSIKNYYFYTKELINDFAIKRGERIMEFNNEQNLLTNDMKSLFKSNKVIAFCSIILNICLTLIILFKILPQITYF